MNTVVVEPELLRWAYKRAGKSATDLLQHFPKLESWERGTTNPTLKELERFAKATRTPFGFLFLPHPPVEVLPIPDFRTIRAKALARPSPDLLDTIYICQQRQEWYRDFARSEGAKALTFVGSVNVGSEIKSAAEAIRKALGFEIERRREFRSWSEALRHFVAQAEELGILVMVSGVVGSNNKRNLDPQEFRGFVLTDSLAPLIFINGADTKSAQMFTLAHELVHVWLGETAVSNTELVRPPKHQIERWCNEVAAELLVPLALLKSEYRHGAALNTELSRLARYFKVSTLVILRRIYDAGGIEKKRFWQEHEEEVSRLEALPKGSGGDFYLTQAARASKRFSNAIVVSALEGKTLYRDAMRLLGVTKLATFRKLGESLEVM